MGKMNQRGVCPVANAESALVEVMGETSRLLDIELKSFFQETTPSRRPWALGKNRLSFHCWVRRNFSII